MAAMLRRKGGKEAAATEDRRILILDKAKCKPKSAAWEFLKRHAGGCGKDCIEVIDTPARKSVRISEECCAVCLNRAKKCPGDAVQIVNLPQNLNVDTTHRYGENEFKLHGLPVPRPGHVLGLLGINGIGKSTAVNILSGKVKPNLGRIDDPPGWSDIIAYYRGSDLQNYFKRLVEDKLTVATKPQLDAALVRRFGARTVGEALGALDELGHRDAAVEALDLGELLGREVRVLSGGELQRFVTACTILRDADVYIFDELSSFLDVRQRLRATELVRGLLESAWWQKGTGPDAAAAAAGVAASKYVIVVEHDLAVLDYMSDFVSCLYGEPGCFGVVTKRASVRNGINQFLSGYLPAENLRFRAEALTFKVTSADMQVGEEAAAPPAAKDAKDGKAGVSKDGTHYYLSLIHI